MGISFSFLNRVLPISFKHIFLTLLLLLLRYSLFIIIIAITLFIDRNAPVVSEASYAELTKNVKDLKENVSSLKETSIREVRYSRVYS